EPLIERMHIIPFHRDFLEHLEFHPKFAGTKFFYLLVAARFLTAKVICGKTQNHQFVPVLFMKFLEISILSRITTLGSHIDQKYLFAFKSTEINQFPFNRFHLKPIKRFRWLGWSCHILGLAFKCR